MLSPFLDAQHNNFWGGKKSKEVHVNKQSDREIHKRETERQTEGKRKGKLEMDRWEDGKIGKKPALYGVPQ